MEDSNEDFHQLSNLLHHIQHTINHNHSLIKSYKHGHKEEAQAIFRENIFADVSPLPILYWRIVFRSEFIGNTLESYFGSVACAYKSGFHFIGISPQVDHENEPFYRAFPFLIPHTRPLATTSRVEMRSIIDKYCTCDTFCFHRGNVWESYIPQMRRTMQDAIRLHLTYPRNGIFPENAGLFLHKERDYFTIDTGTYLPLIPDVAIHFRCSDNIIHGMGLLSVKTIVDRIPKNAKYIYIFSEYGQRIDPHIRELGSMSAAIVKGVWQDISHAFPDAIVIAKRGMNVFTTMSTLGLANITICSPSSFCFYPAMSREKLTYFIAGDGRYIDSDTPIHPNFHFVKGSNLIFSNFTRNNTVSEILGTLRQG